MAGLCKDGNEPLGSLKANNIKLGAKGDWDFRISDLVKNPDGTDI